MNRGERLGCGVLALLVFISFTFGFLGGGVAGVSLLLVANAVRSTPTPQIVEQLPSSLIQPAQPTSTSSSLPAANSDQVVIDAVRAVEPSVVTIISTMPSRRSFFGTIPGPVASGSGVIIDNDGHVLTNNHVIDGAQSLSIILASGERRDAKLIGSDEFSDLAVVQVSSTKLSAAILGDSSSLVQGQRVIAIGSALGDFRNTVTAGVVSGLGRSVQTDSDFNLEDLVQTDAAINEGNSGGPLIDLQGRVIGINTLIVGRSSGSVVAEGLGFAIAANTAREVAQQIIKTGRVARPYLGIIYQAVSPQVASYYGLSANSGILVTQVAPNTPAGQAGVQVGDVILKIADEELNDTSPFLNALMHHRPGDKVRLSINRSGQTQTIEATLGERQP